MKYMLFLCMLCLSFGASCISSSFGQEIPESLTYPELDPEYRYTFESLAGRKPIDIPYPKLSFDLTFEAIVSFSIRPDGWVEQVHILYPKTLIQAQHKRIIKAIRKWKFTAYASEYNHPTTVNIWFDQGKISFQSTFLDQIEQTAEGLDGRRLIYAPAPLKAGIKDTVQVELEINNQGRVTHIHQAKPMTPTYRSTHLLVHRAIQAVYRWTFEEARTRGNQRITVFIPVEK